MDTTSKKGVKPEWAALPMRRCDNCGKRYKPKQPLREGQKYGFCKPECKKQFHKHGAAYIQLKGVVEKMVNARMAELEKRLREIAREESAYLENQTSTGRTNPVSLSNPAAHFANR